MEGIGVKFTPGIGDVYYAIQACLGLWLALLGLIASPNGPNGWFSPPPASHPPPPPAPPPSHPPTPYNMPSVILERF